MRSQPWCLRYLRCAGKHRTNMQETPKKIFSMGSFSAPYLRVPISTSLQDKPKIRELGWQTNVLERRLCSRSHRPANHEREPRSDVHLTLNLKPRNASSRVDLPSDCTGNPISSEV